MMIVVGEVRMCETENAGECLKECVAEWAVGGRQGARERPDVR